MQVILKYSCILFFVSFLSLIALIFVENSLEAQLIISIVGMVITIITVLYCKKRAKAFIKPSDEILEKMEIQSIPVIYNPNKYLKSSIIFGYTTYLIVISNVFAYLSYKYSVVVEQPGGYSSLIIQDDYMLLSIVFLMIGVVSFVLWAKLRQAYCVFSEKDDFRRAKLNGFAIAVQRQAQKLNLYYQLSKLAGKR